MVDDVIGCRINFDVGIVVHVGGELCKFAIELLFPLPHGFGEKGFGEGMIGVDVTMASSCWGNRLLSWCVSKMEGSFVGIRFVNTSDVWYIVNTCPKMNMDV